MPIVIVSGVPDSATQEMLERLCDDIKTVVAKTKGLGVSKNHVTVFFPEDKLKAGLGEEIIVQVILFEKSYRTDAILGLMSEAIGLQIQTGYFPQAFVEVIPIPMDARRGYWSHRP